MEAAEAIALRQTLAGGLRDCGRRFLAPSTWEWFLAARAEALRRRQAGLCPDLTGAELLALLPRYDGSAKQRHRATCNRWIAHGVQADVFARVLGRVRVRTRVQGWDFDKLAVAHNPEAMRRAIERQNEDLLATYRSLSRYHGGVRRSRAEALEWTWRWIGGPEI